ncbi:hypothetical protein MAR_030630 [Mya arenaria]|uniref:Ribosomal protein S16 n=1 Tax=Mya arenaria TaxID=6604 RepID=A0ABY7F4Q5_MYAAR|nr:hypothetical protein MAR_030469 [Mya arenaria]WAR16036.1 hypothetical protein MAR_030630 [Mya arenaria]
MITQICLFAIFRKARYLKALRIGEGESAVSFQAKGETFLRQSLSKQDKPYLISRNLRKINYWTQNGLRTESKRTLVNVIETFVGPSQSGIYSFCVTKCRLVKRD